MEKKSKTIIGSILIVLLGFGAWKLTKNQNSVVYKPDEKFVVTKNLYKDGIYTETGSYMAPSGLENIDITVTLKNNVVTDVSFVGKAESGGSVFAQNNFSAGFKEQVIGKNINEIHLTVVNGASLTPKGFNDALTKIKAAALTK